MPTFAVGVRPFMQFLVELCQRRILQFISADMLWLTHWLQQKSEGDIQQHNDT